MEHELVGGAENASFECGFTPPNNFLSQLLQTEVEDTRPGRSAACRTAIPAIPDIPDIGPACAYCSRQIIFPQLKCPTGSMMEVSTQIDGSGLLRCPCSRWESWLWSWLVYFLLSEGGSGLAGADVTAQLCCVTSSWKEKKESRNNHTF